MVVPIILTVLFLFPFMGSIPAKLTEGTMVTNYANAETLDAQENATSSTDLLEPKTNTTIFKNATPFESKINKLTRDMCY